MVFFLLNSSSEEFFLGLKSIGMLNKIIKHKKRASDGPTTRIFTLNIIFGGSPSEECVHLAKEVGI